MSAAATNGKIYTAYTFVGPSVVLQQILEVSASNDSVDDFRVISGTYIKIHEDACYFFETAEILSQI